MESGKKNTFSHEVKLSEWSLDRIQEAFEKVAKDDARKLSTRPRTHVELYRLLLATHHRASKGDDVTLVPAL